LYLYKSIKNGRISDHCNFNYSHEIIVIKHLLEQEAIHYFFENENLVLSILLAALHMAESNSKFILTILKKYKIARQLKQQFENRLK
jgi:hypothetical protein